MRTNNDGYGLYDITREGDAFRVTMLGFTDAGAVGGYLWPTGPLPAGVHISMSMAVEKPVQMGDFDITGVTEATVAIMEPYSQHYFRLIGGPGIQNNPPTIEQPPALVQNLRIWFKAFIPFIQFEAPVGGCFSGDSRGFSGDIGASARMHSEITIQDLYSANPTYSEQHHCGETHIVSCDDGTVLEAATASTEMMKFFNFRHPGATVWDWDQPYPPDAHPPEVQVPDDAPVSISYKGMAGNPLVPVAPLIDMWAEIAYDRNNHVLTVNGKVDAFPAFEAYVSWYGGPSGQGHDTIFTFEPGEGGPTGLIGDANRPFNWSIGLKG